MLAETSILLIGEWGTRFGLYVQDPAVMPHNPVWVPGCARVLFGSLLLCRAYPLCTAHGRLCLWPSRRLSPT